MADTTKTDTTKTFRQILGLDTASKPVQTVAGIIGAALYGGGLYASFQNQPKSYETYTKNEQSRISEIGSAFGAKTDKEAKAFEADLAGYTESAVEGTKTGLQARGITDTSVAKEAGAKTRSGLSGAYAAARSALAMAKVNATNQMDTNRANYMQEVVKKQYESMLDNYYGKMPLWGALGGAGVSILSMPSTKKKDGKTVDYNDYTVSPEEATTKFRMKGVPESEPFRMRGV